MAAPTDNRSATSASTRVCDVPKTVILRSPPCTMCLHSQDQNLPRERQLGAEAVVEPNTVWILALSSTFRYVCAWPGERTSSHCLLLLLPADLSPLRGATPMHAQVSVILGPHLCCRPCGWVASRAITSSHKGCEPADRCGCGPVARPLTCHLPTCHLGAEGADHVVEPPNRQASDLRTSGSC